MRLKNSYTSNLFMIVNLFCIIIAVEQEKTYIPICLEKLKIRLYKKILI